MVFDKLRDSIFPHHRNANQQGQEPTPGKATLVNPVNRADTAINDRYVDQGPTHAGKGDDIFSAGQRGRLINAFQQRTLAADSAFKTALTQIRVDKLIEKPADMSWVLNLALMAIGSWSGTVIKQVMTSMASQGADALLVYLEKDLSDRMTKLSTGLYRGILAASEAFPKKTSIASKTIANSITGARKWESKMASKADVDFLDLLGSQTAVMFQQIRETAMLGLSDAELLGLHEAWDVQRNSVGDYKQQITDLIGEYKKSDIKSLGRGDQPFADGDKDPGMGAGHPGVADGPDKIDRFVVRLYFQSGETPRYAIADKYIDPNQLPNAFTGMPKDERNEPLKEGMAGKHALKYTMEKYSLIKLVHPDLEQVSIIRHREAWHAEPNTLIVDDVERAKTQGPSPDGKPVQPAVGKKNPMTYNIEDTKGLDWNDVKTWKYENKQVEDARLGHDAKEGS
jgi:hypothetical protein